MEIYDDNDPAAVHHGDQTKASAIERLRASHQFILLTADAEGEWHRTVWAKTEREGVTALATLLMQLTDQVLPDDEEGDDS